MATLDPEIMSTLASLKPQLEKATEPQPLDPDVAQSLGQAKEYEEARRKYLRERYAWRLADERAPHRHRAARDASREITEPLDQRWLTDEVEKISKAVGWNERRRQAGSGLLRRVAETLYEIPQAISGGAVDVAESHQALGRMLGGEGVGEKGIQFRNVLEAAYQSGDPQATADETAAWGVVKGAARIAPQVYVGAKAFGMGGRAGLAGQVGLQAVGPMYERMIGEGVSPTIAAALAVPSSAAVGAIESMVPIPGLGRSGFAGAGERVAARLGEKVAGKAMIRRGVEAGVRAVGRFGGEYLGETAGEEFLQGAIEEAASQAGARLAGVAEGREPGEILKAGLRGTREALGPMLPYALVGAGAHVAGGIAESRRRAEVIRHAEEGKAPSRAQWKAWGLPAESGMSAKQRLEEVRQLADEYRAAEKRGQLKPPVAAVTPAAMPTVQKAAPGVAQEATGGPVAEARPEVPAGTEVPTGATVVPHAVPVEAALGTAVEAEPTAPIAAEAVSAMAPAVQEASMAQRMAPAQPGMAVEMEGTGEQVGGREVVKKLEELWGIPIRAGRLGRHKARGIYKQRPQVTRLAKGEEASPAVVAHEVSHHLENTSDVLKSAPPRAIQEVAVLDYEPKKARPGEGFAEFVRGYVTGSTEHQQDIDLAKVAPEFSRHFEQWLSANPEMRERLDATKQAITQWRQAGAVGRVKGQISKTGREEVAAGPIRERIRNLWDFIYTRFKEEGLPIQRFVEEAEKRGYVPKEGVTPYDVFNAFRQAGPHFAANAVENGIFKLTGRMEKIGPSLTEVLSEIGDNADYENFVAWTYARHAIESWEKGKNPGITLSDAEETYRRLYDPRYERAANGVTQFNNALIGVLLDVGAIDQEAATRILSYYKTYVPLQRAKQGGRLGGGGGRRMVDLSAAIKGRRGSGLQVIDPIEVTAARAITLYERAAKHAVVNALVQTANDVDGLGNWIEEVPPRVLATTFTVDSIKPQLSGILEAAGLDPDEIMSQVDPMAAMTVWKPDMMKVHGQPIMRTMVDGKPRFYQLHPELLEALGGLDTLQHLDIATRAVRPFTSAVKIGATRFNPSFWIKNAFRDFQTFLMQGERGLRGAFDPAQYSALYVMSECQRAAGKEGDPVVRLWQKMGGELSTYAGLDFNRLKGAVRRARAGRQGIGATFASVGGVTEVAPRIAEFSAILAKEGWLDRAKAGETPPLAVLIRAINAAHDVTIDFRRMGKIGRYLNYWVPFFNARVEGVDKFMRTWRDTTVRTGLRTTASLVPLSILYWWLRHDDDDYKERPIWQDAFFILPDKDGNPMVRIPKSQEWGLIASGIERLLDAMYEKDPEAMERWGKQVLETVIPDAYPAGVTPLFETLYNYDSFRQRPIVSENLQKLEAPDQAYEYTSGLAKTTARFLHELSGGRVSLSPAKIDHLANGLLGGLYGEVTGPVEKAVRGEALATSDIPGMKGLTLRKDYAKSVDDFYSMRDEAEKLHESNKLREKKEPEDLDRWHMIQGVASLMTDMRNVARSLPEADRKSTELATVGLARAALGRRPLKRYPNPLVDPSGLPRQVVAAIQKHIGQKAATASQTGRRSREEAGQAAKYLRSLGVSMGTAQTVAYTRLRSQGMKSEAARERAKHLR